MATWGAPIDVEVNDVSPFKNTHQLCSSHKPHIGIQPIPLGLYSHGEYIVDGLIHPGRLPIYQSIWTYLSELGTCESNCTLNETFCTISGECESLSDIYSGPSDPCGCDPGPITINPAFVEAIVLIPTFIILLIAGIITGICWYKRKCCSCCYRSKGKLELP